MRKSSAKTRYPGVERAGDGRYRVRGKYRDARTGTKKEVDRLVEAASASDASRVRAQLMAQAKSGELAETERVQVGAYAKCWIESKMTSVDVSTLEHYVTALETHVLPVVGEFYYDALRPMDVQRWVNHALRKEKPRGGSYSVISVKGWFRVFRSMTQDAVAQLGLALDPTARIHFPDEGMRDGNNAQPAAKLGDILDVMRKKFPDHHAITATLLLTGLRFCHVCALRWEDVDYEEGVLHIVRKSVRGRIGPVSRRKRAPRRYPLSPELEQILRDQRQRLLAAQAPGLSEGWVFPSSTGTVRFPSSLKKAWDKCLAEVGIEERFTVHGLRRSFNDLARHAGLDPIVTRSLTGHVTEAMREHYSTVDLDEKRRAVGSVVGLVPGLSRGVSPTKGGDAGGDEASKGNRS